MRKICDSLPPLSSKFSIFTLIIYSVEFFFFFFCQIVIEIRVLDALALWPCVDCRPPRWRSKRHGYSFDLLFVSLFSSLAIKTFEVTGFLFFVPFILGRCSICSAYFCNSIEWEIMVTFWTCGVQFLFQFASWLTRHAWITCFYSDHSSCQLIMCFFLSFRGRSRVWSMDFIKRVSFLVIFIYFSSPAATFPPCC